MSRKIFVKDLVELIEQPYKITGNMHRFVTEVSPIDATDSLSLTFCIREDEAGLLMIRDSKAAVVICHNNLQFTEDDIKTKTFIQVADPRSVFIRIMKEYFVQEKIEYGIDSTAIIEKGAEIHDRVMIGPHCYIGKSKIDAGTIIHGNTYIYPKTIIGRNVIIQAGSVIGAEAMGFARNKNKELENFPQTGGVIIEDNVQIGPCTSISVIRNTTEIGENVTVGMGAIVTKNVDDFKIVYGNPAVEKGEVHY
jgi:UDP-3-O-[3-hydroxymyristoyl] glucosamine N-acyltransferase